MNDLNILFRNRISVENNIDISFEMLEEVLEKTAKTIPFENLRIIDDNTTTITKSNVMNKILEKNEGGLCYELNTILYLFLLENDFRTTMVRGVVFDQQNQQWSQTGKSHVTNLLNHDGKLYLVDTGFGGNLPLKPIPLTGETVVSNNGEFRVEKIQNQHGDYILYMKLRYKDKDWKIGYTFDSKKAVRRLTELNEIQETIINHPESPFNKKRLITRFTDEGNVILTDTSFIQWINGEMTKEEIDNEKRFNEIKQEFFHL